MGRGRIPQCCLPTREDALPVGIDVEAHLFGIIAAAVREAVVTLFKAGDLVPVDLGPKTGAVRDPDGAVFKLDPAADQDFIRGVLPRVMGIAGKLHGRRSAAGVDHDEQAEAEVVVGVHREAESEAAAEIAEPLDGADTAPVVGIREDDLDCAAAPSRKDILEARDGDIRGKGDVSAGREKPAADLGHAIEARTRVFEITAAA
jgi:hypothetical protein